MREALAETAYAAEDFGVALNEYRALRRMTGDTSYLPVMADCERALGKPEEALRLIREAKLASMTQRAAVELVIVEAGAREDLGQTKEGLRTLKSALSQLSRDIPHEAHARLAYAYAAMLLRHGQEDQAREWFATADRLDVARELDAGDQLELMDGLEFEFDFDEEAVDEDEDQVDAVPEGLTIEAGAEEGPTVDSDGVPADDALSGAVTAIEVDRPSGAEPSDEIPAEDGPTADPDESAVQAPVEEILPLGEDPTPLTYEQTPPVDVQGGEPGHPAESGDRQDDAADPVEVLEGQESLFVEDAAGSGSEQKRDADE